MYTNPPPYGYGTPAPKTAKTVLRSLNYNKNKDMPEKAIRIAFWDVPDTRVWGDEEYDFNNTVNNFCLESWLNVSGKEITFK